MLTDTEIDNLKTFIKDNEHKGVEVRPSGFRLSINYKGKKYRRNYSQIAATEANATAVARDYRMMKLQIKQRTFDVEEEFPDQTGDIRGRRDRPLLVSSELKLWYSSLTDKRPHTLEKYKLYQEIVEEAFGKLKLTDLTTSQIKSWLANLSTVEGEPLANSTLNLYLIPLRGIFRAALEDKLINYDPMAFIPTLKVSNRVKEYICDPFTSAEIKQITDTKTRHLGELNAVDFGAWTGLRPSELLALAWDDVDLENNCVYVKRTMVYGNYGATKNDGSRRKVDLLAPARSALIRQKLLSFMYPKLKVKVLDDENKKLVEFELGFVFLNSNTQKPFDNTRPFNRFMAEHLANAGVRYRSMKQLRHTYASQLLTQGMRERWIATQMGHRSLAMLEQHYAKFIQDDMADMVEEANKLMGFNIAAAE